MAVAEFYQLPDAIDREVGDARLGVWAIVAVAVIASYLLLYGIVKRGSDTITNQDAALKQQVGELSGLLQQNAALSDRVRTAAERSTTLNERALRRISSDLHDGPGQMIALALLRLDAVRGRFRGRATQTPSLDHAAISSGVDPELDEVERALRDALRDMRGIAAGLRMPELAPLSARGVAARAIDDHARRSGNRVQVEYGVLPEEVALPVKICLFRALQELLSNATRHAAGVDVSVRLNAPGGRLELEVADGGQGFVPATVGEADGLGLAGVREQAELLGGGFEVQSAPGHGATVRVWWALIPSRPSQGGDPAPSGATA